MRGVPGFSLSAVVLAYLALSSCQRSEDRYLRREVVEGEVPGLWRLEPGSVQELRDVGYTGAIDPAAHEIVLRKDRTCRFRSLRPPFDERSGFLPVLDSECRWSLRSSRHQTLEIDLERDEDRGPYYYFGETREGRLVLWQHLSDPDAWRYVEYVKQ